ncbi:hypothetical protein GCM10009854_29230 [Saccharopolyspora halophila]|uniref:Uncharacterized protein n=1 Tax=Saccharopolyspora halophila TaxID=405551 RepID=A0ABN3GEQ2_9PSEU
MAYSTNSARLADLARRLRVIEDEIQRCDRAAAVRRKTAQGAWKTVFIRSAVDQAADDLDEISEEWADEGI